MIPLFGIGTWPAVAALFFYSLLPIVRNTHAGLAGIAPDLRGSAAALGLPPGVRPRQVELPMATRPILAGIRLDDIGLILEGAVPAALLALIVQGVFEGVERRLTPRGLRIEARQ